MTRAITRKSPGLRASNGYVSVSAYGDNLESLRAQLVAKGLKDATVHATAVSGRAPVAALADMAATSGLKFLRPSMAMARVGSVTTQGDRSLRANRARAESGVNGRGVRVGVLSDSYDCAEGAFQPGAPFTRAAQDIARNDLPRDVLVLKDYFDEPNEDCSDEGRAMMQLIHDVAPGSPQAFYTAFISEEDFADGIRALAKAGSKVIVDDIIYFEEPMFEDGIIAQAVDDVYKDGVAYFSAAGNDARLSYESRFRLSNRGRNLRQAARFRQWPSRRRSAEHHCDRLQRHATSPCSGISPRCPPTASAARRATLTSGSTTPTATSSISAPTIRNRWSARSRASISTSAPMRVNCRCC